MKTIHKQQIAGSGTHVLALIGLALAFDGNEYAERLVVFWFWLATILLFIAVLISIFSKEQRQKSIANSADSLLIVSWFNKVIAVTQGVLMIAWGWAVGGFFLAAFLLIWLCNYVAKEEAANEEVKENEI